jgi:pimeloyl-ACP methyl ester carboxylesterase
MLETILNVIFGLASAVAVIIGIGYFWGWFYACPTSQDETGYVRTSDGWRLAVHRYCEGKPTGLPVVLCHGMSANRYPFDIKGAPSLARYLKARGWDVWVAELRGSGMSDRPGFLTADVPYTWTFEDHLRKDLPAIINYVLERTGAPAIHWIGHSMGGMLGLAHVAAQTDPPIASMVAMGSPVDFSKMRMRAFPILAKLRWLLYLTHVPPMPFIGRLIIPVAHKLPRCLLGLFQPSNITPSIARRVVALGSTLITSRGLWMDFGRYVETRVLGSEKGQPYLENLSQSRVPILTLAASEDRMAPPESVIALCNEAKGTAGGACMVFGKGSGCVEDYGHMDLLLGIRVEKEVFVPILEWLESHDGSVREPAKQVAESMDRGEAISRSAG